MGGQVRYVYTGDRTFPIRGYGTRRASAQPHSHRCLALIAVPAKYRGEHQPSTGSVRNCLDWHARGRHTH